MVRRFLQQETDRGRLVPTKLAERMGYAPRSSIMSMVLSGARPFPMDRIDAVAQFFGFQFAEDFIRLARRSVLSEGGPQASTAERFPGEWDGINTRSGVERRSGIDRRSKSG